MASVEYPYCTILAWIHCLGFLLALCQLKAVMCYSLILSSGFIYYHLQRPIWWTRNDAAKFAEHKPEDSISNWRPCCCTSHSTRLLSIRWACCVCLICNPSTWKGCSVCHMEPKGGSQLLLLPDVRILWDPLLACHPPRAHSTELFPDPRPVPSCTVAQDSATAFLLLESIAIHDLSAGEWSNQISWTDGYCNKGGISPAVHDKAATVVFGFETHRQRF